MKKINFLHKGFTLIELLVVITILAIISVVAYTNFSGSTDKAKNSKKLNDISSIETGLQTFFQEKNYYPMPSQYNQDTNVWGYDSSKTATPTATFSGTKEGDQIKTVLTGAIVGGGRVYLSGSATQIGAKGTIDSEVLSKQYLSQELSDPSLSSIKVGDTETLKDYGIGEYIYGVYSKSGSTVWDSTSKKGLAYNIALTLQDDQKGYLTKLIGNFDKTICVNCPDSLIGSGTVSLKDGYFTGTTTADGSDQLVPYPIDGF